MENIFPEGLFHFYPTETILFDVLINVLFSAWVVFTLIKTKNLFYKVFFSLALIWNVFLLYMDLFYVFLPVPNEVLSAITIGFWIGAISSIWLNKR